MTPFAALVRRFTTLSQIFASGANRVGDLLGFVAAGVAPGVAVHELNDAAARLLVRLAGSGIPLFLDSGAFSEVSFGPCGPVVKAPITDAEWRARLAVMQRVAEVGGAGVTVVAPDQVGSQSETLDRLARYRDEVRALVASGARVLVPLQQGQMAPVPFYMKACDVVGLPLIPALPMKKAATSPSEAVGTLEQIGAPSAHLLGLGIKGSQAADILRTAAYLAPRCALTMDANLITASVGRASGLRPLTAALDAVRDAMTESAWGETILPVAATTLDYTDLVGSPSEWLIASEARRVADEAALVGAERTAFLADPDSVDLITHPALDFAMDGAWRRFVDRVGTGDRQARATATCFANHPAAGQFVVPRWVTDLAASEGEGAMRNPQADGWLAVA